MPGLSFDPRTHTVWYETARGRWVLVGSGASACGSTGLPSWTDLIKAVIQNLSFIALDGLPPDDVISIRKAFMKVREILQSQGARLEDYRITDIFVRRLGIDYLAIMSAFEHSTPNELHRVSKSRRDL